MDNDIILFPFCQHFNADSSNSNFGQKVTKQVTGLKYVPRYLLNISPKSKSMVQGPKSNVIFPSWDVSSWLYF